MICGKRNAALRSLADRADREAWMNLDGLDFPVRACGVVPWKRVPRPKTWERRLGADGRCTDVLNLMH